MINIQIIIIINGFRFYKSQLFMKSYIYVGFSKIQKSTLNACN